MENQAQANYEQRRAALHEARPKTIEEVDAWMVNYLAVIDGHRAEALRVERLCNAAPDLVRALEAMQKLLDKNMTFDGAAAVFPFESHDQAINHIYEARHVVAAALAKAKE